MSATKRKKGRGVYFLRRTTHDLFSHLTPVPLSERSFTQRCRRALPDGGWKMAQLTSLRLAGWKSIRDAKIELRPLNVLIGANGAGKSNLVSFFKLMNEMMGGRFQIHVGTTGAESLLHYGSKWTQLIEADFRFTAETG